MRPALAVIVAVLAAAPAQARRPAEAPPLPAPDPGVYTIVEVDTAQELAEACWNLTSDQAILIAPGSYDLADVDFPNGVDGRLTVGRYGAPPIANVQIRGATGDPSDVVIFGAGMSDPIVPYGFQIFTAIDVLIADLSIGGVYYHTVAIQNDQGASRVRLHNCRLHDAGEQIVKGNRGNNPGAEDVVIEYCEIFLGAGAIIHPDLGYCYTNAIDAIGGRRWIIRDNLIRGIYCQDGSLAGPAVLMWQGSVDTIVERNTFVECARGVALGLVSSQDHSGGIVRNNFLRWDPGAAYQRDVPISTTSPGSAVLHNSVLVRGTYVAGVEVRFAGATGVEVRGNLMDAGVWVRDGATPAISGNLSTAQPQWFLDEPAGDLHLVDGATAAIDQLDPHPSCGDDFDAEPRPAAGGSVDIGGDELEAPLFTDGFESGDTSAWSAAYPVQQSLVP